MAVVGNIERYPLKTPETTDRVFGWDETLGEFVSFNVADFVGGNVINPIQNNKVPVKPLGNITTNIANLVNSTPQFEVKEDEILAFTAIKNEVTGGEGNSAYRQAPGGNPILNMTSLTYILKTGKGFYGSTINTPTTQLHVGNFLLVDKRISLIDLTQGDNPLVFNIPNQANNNLLIAINLAETYVIPSNQDTFFVVNNAPDINGRSIYRFVGASGTYGENGSPIQLSDLLLIEDDSSQIIDNNIKVIEKAPITIQIGENKITKLNNAPFFRVRDNEVHIINFREFKVERGERVLYESSYFLKKGKGNYGLAGLESTTTLTERDLKINFEKLVLIPSISVPVPTGTVGVSVINEPATGFSTPSQDINLSQESIVKTTGQTLIVEHNKKFYDFVAADGTYGANDLQTSPSDFEAYTSLEDSVGIVRTKSISLTMTDIKSAHNTPIALPIQAPDANHVIVCLPSQVEIKYGTIPFDKSVEIQIVTDTLDSPQLVSNNTFITSTSDIISLLKISDEDGNKYLKGKGLSFIAYNPSDAEIKDGDSKMILHLSYIIKKV